MQLPDLGGIPGCEGWIIYREAVERFRIVAATTVDGDGDGGDWVGLMDGEAPWWSVLPAYAPSAGTGRCRGWVFSESEFLRDDISLFFSFFSHCGLLGAVGARA